MSDLKNLGRQTPHVLQGADETLLEAAPNPAAQYSEVATDVTITGDEFTSLCPMTGGPDFGAIRITYCPRALIVESKSLKYYLESFRNQGMFHEQIVAKICHDLAALLDPEWVTVMGEFKPRGGWAIRPVSGWRRSSATE